MIPSKRPINQGIYRLAMSIDHLLQDNRKEILKIAAENGAKSVRVFGSMARDEVVMLTSL